MIFKDKKHRDIELGLPDQFLRITAKHQGDIIGRFMFEDLGNGNIKLLAMDIDLDYQQCGIGSEMLKIALDTWKEFEVPKDYTQRSEGDGDYLEEDAVEFFKACCNNGVCKKINRKILR
jgi:N-acetylglutamate synthase-like GNAT family acetyltransferase